jgi:hypothetical protein
MCRRIARHPEEDGNCTWIGSGDTVRCGRRLGIVGRMGTGCRGTRVGCKQAQGELSMCSGTTGRAADMLSGSGTDEHQCNARVRRAEPGMRHEVDGQRRTDMRATQAAHCAGA